MAERTRLARGVRSPDAPGKQERLAEFKRAAAPPPPQDDTSFSLLGGTDSGRLGSFVGSVSTGVGRGLAAVPEALEIATTGLYNLATDSNHSADDFYNPILDGGSDLIKDFFGVIAQENPEYAQEAQSLLGQGLGSVGSQLVGGVAAAGAKGIAKLAVGTGIAAAQLGVEGVEDYRATVEAQEQLADGRKEFQTFAANVPLAALEMLSLKGMFRTFDKAAGGTLDNMVGDALHRGTVEAATEAMQNIGSNLIAKDLIAYDSERDMWQATKQAAAVGGGVGVIVSVIASLLGGRVRTSSLHAQEQPKEFGPLQKTLLAAGIARPKSIDDTLAETRQQEQDIAALNPVTNQELTANKVIELQLAMDKARRILPNAEGSNKQYLESVISNYEAELKEISTTANTAIERQEALDVLKGENRNAPRTTVEQTELQNAIKDQGINLPTITGEGGGILQLVEDGKVLDTTVEESINDKEISELWDKINANPTPELLLDFEDTFPVWFSKNVKDDSVVITGEPVETIKHTEDRAANIRADIEADEIRLNLSNAEFKVEAKAAGLTIPKYKQVLKANNKSRKAELKALDAELATPEAIARRAQEADADAVARQEEVEDLQAQFEEDEVVGEADLDLPPTDQTEETVAVNKAYEASIQTTDTDVLPEPNLIPDEETTSEEEPETAPQVETTTEPGTVTEPAVQQTEETVQTDTTATTPESVEVDKAIRHDDTIESLVRIGKTQEEAEAIMQQVEAGTKTRAASIKEDLIGRTVNEGFQNTRDFEMVSLSNRASEMTAIIEDLTSKGLVLKKGKTPTPYKTAAAAAKRMSKDGLAGTHNVIHFGGGFAIAPAKVDLKATPAEGMSPPSFSQEHIDEFGSTGTTANAPSTSRITTLKTGTTVQRDHDFETEGTYIVTLTDGQIFHIHRDTFQFSEPTWHVSEIQTVAGFAGTRAETIAKLEAKVKAPTSLVGEDGEVFTSEVGKIDVKVKNLVGAPIDVPSIVDFVVEEDYRGQGEGTKLLAKALAKHPEMQGQFSSVSSVAIAYKKGFRHPSLPNGTLEEHLAKRAKDSSVYMRNTQLDTKPAAPVTETVDEDIPIDFDGEFVIYPRGKSRFQPEPQLTGTIHRSNKTGKLIPQKPWKTRNGAQKALDRAGKKDSNIYQVIPYEGGFAIAPNAEMLALVASKSQGGIAVGDFSGSTLHTLRNNDDLSSVLNNGLAGTANVSIGQPGQSLMGDSDPSLTLVYNSDELSVTPKAHRPEEGTVTQANNAQPVALMVSSEAIEETSTQSEEAFFEEGDKLRVEISKKLGIPPLTDSEWYGGRFTLVSAEDSLSKEVRKELGISLAHRVEVHQRSFDELSRNVIAGTAGSITTTGQHLDNILRNAPKDIPVYSYTIDEEGNVTGVKLVRAPEATEPLIQQEFTQEGLQTRLDNVIEGNATNSTTVTASASNAKIISLQEQIQDAVELGRPTKGLELRLEREQAILDRNLKTQEDLLEREEHAEAGTTRTMTETEVDETIERLEAGEDVDLNEFDSIVENDTEFLAYGDTSSRFENIQAGRAPTTVNVIAEEKSRLVLLENGVRRFAHTPEIMAKMVDLVAKFNKGAAKFGGQVILAETTADLPTHIKQVLLTRRVAVDELAINTSGLFGRDEKGVPTMYLVASTNGSLADARSTLVHEVVGHFGFKTMFEMAAGGDASAYTTFLEKEAKRNPKLLQEAVNLVSARGYQHLFSHTNILGKNLKVMVGDKVMYLSRQNAGTLMNEFIAFSTEQLLVDPQFDAKYGGLRKRLLAAVRHMFRKMGFAPKDLTVEDIYSLIAESNRRLFDLGNVSAVGFMQQGRGARYMLSKYTDRTEDTFSAEAAAIHGVAPDGSHALEQEAVEIFEAEMTPLQKQVAKDKEADNDALIKRAIEIIRNGGTDIRGKSVFDKWTSAVEGWGRTIAEMPLVKKMEGLRVIGSLGKISDKALYRHLGTEARSFIAKGETITKGAVKAFDGMNSSQQKAALRYFSTKGANVGSIPGLNRAHQLSIERSKQFIEELGEELVGLGVLKRETHVEKAGSYLPKMYYKYMVNQGATSGKRISFMGYLKKQKQLHPHESAELGRIMDPGIVVPETIGTIARDIALMKMTKNMVQFSGEQNLGWVLGEAYKVEVVSITGKKGLTNVYQLGLDKERLKEQLQDGERGDLLGYTQEMGHVINNRIKYLTDLEASAVKLKFKEIDDLMEKLGVDKASITAEMRTKFIKDNYTEMPVDRAYGALSGKLVINAIKNDFVDTIFANDSVDATLQHGHQIWKASKVVWNVPVSTIRNSAGNFALLDMSTNTNSAKLSKWVFQEILALTKPGSSRWLAYANETGVNGTTFSSNELNLVKRTITSELKMAAALEKRKGTAFHKPMAFGISMSKAALDASNTLSEFYGFQEGIFKAVKMRDYITTWESQHDANLDDVNLDPAVRKAVLLEAARLANDAIFDYGEVPGYIKWARKYPFIGSPFVTFMYKSALKMPENLVKHPQKFIKYQVVTSVAAMSMLGMYADWDDDEAEEVLKKLPTYYDNNSSILVLPFKDGNGRPQFIDLTVFLPYAPHVNMLKGVFEELSQGRPSAAATELREWSGLLGAPAFNLGAAIVHNRDAFSGRDIVPDGASPQETLAAIGTYAFSFVMPPVLTERGGIGHLLDNAGIDFGPVSSGRIVNRLGEDKETTAQAAMRIFGINAVPADPHKSRQDVRRSRDFELSQLNKRKAQIRREPLANVPAEEQAAKLREINFRIKLVREKFSEKLN